MDQRISLITLTVANLGRAQAFYDALGWEKASTEDGIVAYNLNNMALALYPRSSLADEIGHPVSREGYSASTLAYNVNSEADVDAVIRAAVDAGATLVKPAEKVFWGGYSGYFADPDGQLWEVAYNPFSPLGTKGEFQWGGAVEG